MFSEPAHNVSQLQLAEGEVVADLGAGTGAYTVAAAEHVGNSGRVYAVEIQRPLAAKLKKQLQEAGTHHVEVLWGDIERDGATKLGDSSVDAVILANVLFQLEDFDGLLREVKRILKPDGRLLVVDWSGSFEGMGPPAEDVVPMEQARAVFEKGNMVFEKQIDAGEHHWGFIARNKV